MTVKGNKKKWALYLLPVLLLLLLGALAARLPFPVRVWEDVIAKRVPPKTVDANLAAFHEGYRFAQAAS